MNIPSRKAFGVFLFAALFAVCIFFPIQHINASTSFSKLCPNGINGIPCPPDAVPGSCSRRASDGFSYCPGYGHTDASGRPQCDGLPQDFKDDFATTYKDTYQYVWKYAFCVLDSDGDGKTNGDEMGDPCCEWAGYRGPPRRSTNTSHPGSPQSTTGLPSCLLAGAPRQPGRPLVAAVRSTSITLDWSTALNPNSDCWCGWFLFRSTIGGSGTIIFSGKFSATSFVDTGLNPSTNYTYWLVAKNLAGNSTTGGIKNVRTLQTLPPSAPFGILLESATNQSLTISCSTPEDNGDPISGYEVQWVSQTGAVLGAAQAAPSSPHTYGSSSWQQTTTYYLRVRAINGIGAGAWSNITGFPTTASNATIPARPNPPRVVNATADTIQLEFDPIDTAGGILLSFEVQMKYGSLNFFTIGSNSYRAVDTLLVTDLNVSVVYTFRIRVRTSVGYSRYSTGIDATVLTCSSCSPAHGRCVLAFPVATCECDSGFTGPSCDQSSLASALVEAEYPYSVLFHPEIDYRMFWRVRGDIIEIALRAKTLGWIGWGAAPQAAISKSIKGCEPIWPQVSSDQYIFWVDDSSGVVYGADFYNHDFTVLCLDTVINGTKSIDAVNGFQQGEYTVIKFVRKLKTGEEHDLDLSVAIGSQTFLAWAVGEKDPSDEANIDQHKSLGKSRGYLTVDLSGSSLSSVSERAHHGLAAIFIILFLIDVCMRLMDPCINARWAKLYLRVRHFGAMCWLAALVWLIACGYWSRSSRSFSIVHAILGWLASAAAVVSALIVVFLESGRTSRKKAAPLRFKLAQTVSWTISGLAIASATATGLFSSAQPAWTLAIVITGCVIVIVVAFVTTLVKK